MHYERGRRTNFTEMKILLLAGGGKSTKYLYNGLNELFEINKVIIEEPVDKKKLVKRRIKKLGYIKALGQIIFSLLVPKMLNAFSKKRITGLEKHYSLNKKEIPEQKIKNVSSVNSDECLKEIEDYKPDLILVNGTRIISSKVLDSVSVPFVNIHVGFTPKYRGVHGGYWALVNKDTENCGVTVHFVDAGIDTGGVIAQRKININHLDNFVTYPVHQYGVGVGLFKEVIQKIKSGENIELTKTTDETGLYYHPTILEYISNYLFKKVK